MRAPLHAAAVVGAVLLVTSSAHADPIGLTTGVIDVLNTSGYAVGSVQLGGEQGFTFDGSMTGFFFAPGGDPLPPGTPLPLEIRAVTSDLTGTATLNGVTYPDVGGLTSFAQAALRLTTMAMLPGVLEAPAQIAAPFNLDVTFTADGQSHSLSGSGTATIFLEQDFGFDVPSWRVARVRADVSGPPVPEPATFLLLTTGAAYLVRTRGRGARARRSLG